MEKIYAVVYNNNAVSQEAYSTFEKALAYVEGRSVIKGLGWNWYDQDGNSYSIRELTVK